MLIAFPRQWHQLAELPQGSYHILYAGVDLQRLGCQGRQLARRLVDRRVNLVRRAQEAEPIMRGLVRQAAAQQPLGAQAIEALLRTLVVLIAQRLLADEQGTDVRGQGPHSYPVQAALALMRQQVHQRIAIDDLAQVASCSPAHFIRQFKHEVGLPPGRFHLRLRLEAAREELTQPDFSITGMAMRYGFSSSQHFSRAFHQMFGLTARKWQRQATASRI